LLLPYIILCFITLILGIICWPTYEGWIKFTNSWVSLFFVCSFCAIFLFQDELYQFFDNHIKKIPFTSPNSLQKHQCLPEILKDDKRFHEIISGTVMVWMEKVNMEKEEKKFQKNENETKKLIEQFKKTKMENIKWLFLFADYYLVQNSKDILYEIYERHYVTLQSFKEITEEITNNEDEPDTIFEILNFLKFIKKQEDEVIITETGSAYCAYLEQTFHRQIQ